MSTKELLLYPPHVFQYQGNYNAKPKGHIYYPSSPDSAKNTMWNEDHVRAGVSHLKQSSTTGYYGNTIKCGDEVPYISNPDGLSDSSGWNLAVEDHSGTSNSYHSYSFDWGYPSNLTSSAWKSYGICPYGIAGASFNLKNAGSNNADAIQIVEMKFIYRRINSPTDKSTQIEDKLLPNGDNSGPYKFRDSFTRENKNAPHHDMNQLKMGKSINLNCWVFQQDHDNGKQHRNFDTQYGLFGLSVSFWVGNTGSPNRRYKYSISKFTPIWAVDASKQSSDRGPGSRIVYPALNSPANWYGDGHGQIEPRFK